MYIVLLLIEYIIKYQQQRQRQQNIFQCVYIYVCTAKKKTKQNNNNTRNLKLYVTLPQLAIYFVIFTCVCNICFSWSPLANSWIDLNDVLMCTGTYNKITLWLYRNCNGTFIPQRKTCTPQHHNNVFVCLYT